MKAIDKVYYASKIIENELKSDSETEKIKGKLSENSDHCTISYTSGRCELDEEWVGEIEEKLPFVEKAVEEARHFLKKEGSVVRIDQVKKVSADSVKHLAKHSNFVTEMPENISDIKPDKLYVTENDENFRLYENRFLFTLLVYLRDFVEKKYNETLSLFTTDKAELEAEVNIKVEKRNISLSINYVEEGMPEEGLMSKPIKNITDRVDGIFESIVAMQNTSLMKMISDMPLLKLPIVATNIIKTDPNFIEAYKLFDYIISYSRKIPEAEEISFDKQNLSAEGLSDMTVLIDLLGLLVKAEAPGERDRLNARYLTGEIPKLSPEDQNIVADIRKMYEKELEKAELEWQQKFEELTILKDAEVDAIRAKFNDFSADDHIEEASFKRLAEEKRVLDRYYKKKWSMVKKKARKELIWDCFKMK